MLHHTCQIGGLATLLLLTACETTQPCDAAATILPNLSPYRLCDHAIGAAEPRMYNVILTNHGCEDLHVTGVEIRGDTRCSFTPPELAGDADSVEPKGNTFVRFGYAPKQHGRDQVALVIRSDAANFPELIVPVCGLGVDTSLTGGNCTSSDDCVEGLECLYGGDARCDGTQPADAACTCQPTCPLCQVPVDARVESCE